MVELDWLMMCYAAARVDTKPLVILYGADTPELSAPTLPTNIRAIRQEQSIGVCESDYVYPGSEFSMHPNSRIQEGQKGNNEYKYFLTEKLLYKALGNMIR
jgi:hypothetical protein